MATILVVDDQRNMRATLGIMLRGAGHEVIEAASGEKACQAVDNGSLDLVLTDLKMQFKDGLDVLRHVRTNAPLTEVIVMTAYGTVESAVEAMRLGAFDYLEKPFTEEELLRKVDEALERRWLSGEANLSAESLRQKYSFEDIVGDSSQMQAILARVAKIAPTDTTVLITGESGTGKELIARAIHRNSKRNKEHFGPVNCAAISEQLLESELFGHVKGSFTGAVANRKGLFEEADGGTFFFDEMADTTPAFQAKLLRAIQDGEVRPVGDNVAIKTDVRIIAATNKNLREAIEAGDFRQDLYYRLNVARIRLPPLRDHRADIPQLVGHFLAKHGKRMDKMIRVVDEVQEFLMRYDFPGNVRELENLLEQGVALSSDGYIHIEDILPEATGVNRRSLTLSDVVSEAERTAIQVALREEGSMEAAAERLGLSTTTLWRKMKKLHIRRDDTRGGPA